MMSYAGHVFDMINRLKQNKALKDARRSRYQKVKDAYQKNYYKHIKFNPDVRTMSEMELEVFRSRIRKGVKSQIIKERIVASVSFIVILIVVYYFFFIYLDFF